jgi:uncharacterized membrane protein
VGLKHLRPAAPWLIALPAIEHRAAEDRSKSPDDASRGVPPDVALFKENALAAATPFIPIRELLLRRKGGSMRILFALIALCGMIVSGLALQVHYSHDTQPCDINERWDCGIVNHSRFAVVHGVPVALIGIVGYTALLVLSFSRRNLLLLIGSAIGFLYALSLTRIEAEVIHVWCLYCVCSQGIITLLLLLSAVMFIHQHRRSRREGPLSQ